MAERKADRGGQQSLEDLRRRIEDLEAENLALRQGVPREQDILEAISNPIFVKDLEGRYVACNEAMVTLSRRDRSEIIGKTAADISPPEAAERSRAADRDLFERGGRQSYVVRMPMGPDAPPLELMINKATFTDGQGRIAGLVGEIVDVTAHKRAETALGESQARYRLLVESAVDVICTVDEKGTFTFINSTGARGMGLEPEQMIGRTLSEFFPPEFAAGQLELVQEAIRTGQGVTREIPIHIGGQTRWYSTGIRPLRDATGSVTLAMVVARDVTEHRDAQQALRDSEEQLELILRGADLGTWDYDFATGKQVVNDRWTEMLGYASGEFAPGEFDSDGFFWMKLIHPDDLPGFREAMDRHLGGQDPFYEAEYRMRTRSGAWRWILARGRVVQRAADGEPLRAAGTHLDITDRKKAEERLRHSEGRLRAILDAAEHVSIITTDLAGSDARIIEFSPGAERMFGFARAEAVGMPLARLHLPEDAERFPRTIERMREKRTGVRSETTLVRKSGQQFPAMLSIDPIFDVAGEMTAVVGVSIDITDLKAAEEALRESEQVERRFRQSLTAMHEVSNELTKAGPFDEFARQAVLLGRDRLGFGRLGLWFVGDEPYVIRGSFGVDENGDIRDERDRRLTIDPQSMMGDMLTHRLSVCVRHDQPLYDADARQVGVGSQVVVSLWDGDRVMGCLSADSLFEGGRMAPEQCELLVLYAAALGHLSSRKRVEEALRSSEEKYRQLTESTNDMIYSADAEGRLTYIGPQVAQYGWRQEEMISRGLLEFVDPEDRPRVTQEFLETMTTGREFPSELRIVDASGRRRWLEDHGKVQRGPDGSIIGLTGILRDITDRKRAEQAAQAAHRKLTTVREQERRRLARELHDSLGQQLIGLQLALENARMETDSRAASQAGTCLDRVADGFGELIREVRRISYGLYPPTLESLGLHAALSQLAQTVTALIGTHVRCAPELMAARYDGETEIALFRIAQEAIHNAVRHSGARSILIDLERTDSQVLLSITDDGEGFDTSAVAGRGLGLVAMTERADAIGGGVEISSRPGQTRIRVHAPC